MPNQIHLHVAKAYAADRHRIARNAHANRGIGRPPNRRIAAAGARAAANIAVRIDREAARRAIA